MNERDMRLVWLQECPGVGPAVLRRVIAQFCGAPPAIFFGRTASEYQCLLDVPRRLAEEMERHLSAVPVFLADAAQRPVRALIAGDLDYPMDINRLKYRPPILLAHGNGCSGLPGGNFCVLSSAKQEHNHADHVRRAITAGVAHGWKVVAGHNRPVYQWGLLAAKRMGRPATMVLDRGLLAAFGEDLRRDPVPAARIWGYAFDADRMLALSPFRLRDPWIGANARLRDAIVVALSDVVIAIGVKEGGTMHRLCRQAAGRGQTVLAAPDCLPLLEPAGARPWTGEMPEPPAKGPEPGEIG
jgi:predicted Rossmann fold nucleotide-binding protein DprA/Smf involved in DNA uptake